MGTFTRPITLHAANRDEVETLEALVDTGASFTTIPAPILQRLGIDPHRNVRLRLANGQIERWALGDVRADLDGESQTIICVFGDPSAPPVIGAHTLEAFLLGVDPVEKRLVPIEAMWV